MTADARHYLAQGTAFGRAMAEALVRLDAAGRAFRDLRAESAMIADSARALDLAGHSLEAPTAAWRALKTEIDRRADAAWHDFTATETREISDAA